VERRVRHVEIPLVREEVDVKRVPVNRVVDVEPEMRHSGDTIIVPVVEEEVVITRRLILKEELHIVKRRITERAKKEVSVERERAEVQRLDERGRVIESSPGHRPPQAQATRKLQRPPNILDR